VANQAIKTQVVTAAAAKVEIQVEAAAEAAIAAEAADKILERSDRSVFYFK
jgi:hypothetical protein